MKTAAKKKKEKYETLRYKYNLFKNLMEAVPDVIYFKDKKGRLVMVNEAHAKGLGLKPEEIVGKTDFDFFPKDRAEKMSRDDLRVLNTGKPIIDKIERATRADGVDNYVSTTKIPRYDIKGNIVGLVGITRDITHRIQLVQLRDEKKKIEKRLQMLEELNKMKSDFISVVSHELRTPLAIMKGAVELISDGTAGPVNDKQRKLLQKTKDSIRRLRGIIDELLDLSRIEGAKLKLQYSLIDLKKLLEESSEFFTRSARGKGITLEYLMPQGEVNIFIDPERVNQVISNLIQNAIKFTEEGGRAKVELEIIGAKIRVGVIDTGAGIARENMEKLFEKFVQLDSSARVAKNGLGLGLSIAKELVEKHGGEIWVESKPGVGSRFYFTLPRFYSASPLEKNARERINSLLTDETLAYFVNIFIVNYDEFKKTVGFRYKRALEDLKNILSTVCSKVDLSTDQRPHIVMTDTKSGEYGILFPEIAEKEAAQICTLFKEEIDSYFKRNKVKKIFVNLSVLPYSLKDEPPVSQKMAGKLYIKKIYIGSEVRHFVRIPYKVNIEITVPEGKGGPFETLDISKGGISFISTIPLELNSKIEIMLDLPKVKKPFGAKARVAWVNEIETQEAKPRFKAGIEFIDLTEKDKMALSKAFTRIDK
ncbi:MAG: PAS domain-containing protein [Candidatus Omnitrophica bacterium]|nr:PAS domain-containing protein [Candidatus Omnitrophota bacterium]